MTDALCGPSNALQSFQKHTSVDRTLQQDRLISRQSPAQAFRSSIGPNAGALDAEFEAFQAGLAPGPPPLEHQHFQTHLPPGLTGPDTISQPPLPEWAADFQNLHLHSLPPFAHQHHLPQPSVQNSSSSWHQDFLNQQAHLAQAQSPHTHIHNRFEGSPWVGGGYRAPYSMQPAGSEESIAHGKQPSEQFDDAAFERAFEAVQAQMMDEAPQGLEKDLATIQQDLAQWVDSSQGSGRQMDRSQVVDDLGRLEALVESRDLQSDAMATHELLHRIVQTDTIPADAQDLQERAKDIMQVMENKYSILKAMEETNHLAALAQQEAVKPTGSLRETLDTLYRYDHPSQEHLSDDQETTFKEEESSRTPPPRDDDELAETAGRLLESVSHDTSKKFQESQFMALMRKLRDREVRVDGEHIVEANKPEESDGRIPPLEQDFDLGRSYDASMSGALNNGGGGSVDHGLGESSRRPPLG